MRHLGGVRDFFSQELQGAPAPGMPRAYSLAASISNWSMGWALRHRGANFRWLLSDRHKQDQIIGGRVCSRGPGGGKINNDDLRLELRDGGAVGAVNSTVYSQ